MAEERTPLRERPVLAGLLALGGVALVVGLLAGVGVLVVSSSLGLGGDEPAASDPATAGGATMVLPEPTDTIRPTGPQITLSGVPTPTTTATPSVQPTESETPEDEIVLQASPAQVAPMQQINLTGSYPTGEGAILQVQRFENGSWNDFPVSVAVSGGGYRTYVMTGQGGENRFRVRDSDSDLASNEVTVTVG